MGPGPARALACPLEVRAAAAVSQGPQAAQTSMASTRRDNESHANVEVKVPYRCPGPLAEQRDLQMPVALGLGPGRTAAVRVVRVTSPRRAAA